MGKYLLTFGLMTLLQVSFVNQAHAGPRLTNAGRTLLVTCDSDDDGNARGALSDSPLGSLYFDGKIGPMSNNDRIIIAAHAENFVRISRGVLGAYVRICLVDSKIDSSVACAEVDKAVVKVNRDTNITVSTSGAPIDPEGINCHLRLQ